MSVAAEDSSTPPIFYFISINLFTHNARFLMLGVVAFAQLGMELLKVRAGSERWTPCWRVLSSPSVLTGSEGGGVRGGRRSRWEVDRGKHQTRSAGRVAAQEGVEHGQLHTLLVPSAPGHHRPLAVGRVEVVAVARVRQAAVARRDGHQQRIYEVNRRWKIVVLLNYLMMGLLDLGKVISLTGFKSQVLHNLDRRKFNLFK